MHLSKITLALCLAILILLVRPTFPSHAEIDQPQLDTNIFLPILRTSGQPAPVDDSITAELVNEGIVETPRGVGIGALSNSLVNPVAVTIEAIADPAVALPPLAQALGPYYRISAAEIIAPDADNSLILAFPVPTGADPAHLAAAALVSNSQAQDVEATEPAWQPLEGRYDPASNRFLTLLSGLEPDGRILVLLSSPEYSSPASSQTQPAQQIHRQDVTPPFLVTCTGFSDPADCTRDMETSLETHLDGLYQRMNTELGFRDPRLLPILDTISYFPNAYTYAGYRAYIEPHDVGWCAGTGGHYTHTTSRLVMCLNPAIGLWHNWQDVLAHEYFHAVEFAYPAFYQDRVNNVAEGWLVEGMAKAAEKSYLGNDMHRSTTSGWEQLHKVDIPIYDLNNVNEYFAQDFWVFAGQILSQNLSYLQSILESGATSQNVSDVLWDGERLDIYHLWARNQAIEATVDFDGALATPCSLELGVVQALEMFDYDFYQNIFHEFSLESLNSIVVKINFDHNYDIAYVDGRPSDPTLPGAWDSFKFKVYKDGESGCESLPDMARLMEDVTTDGDYYVVVSNIDIDETFDYILFIEASPIPGQ